MAAGHGPRRHRHADGRRAPAGSGRSRTGASSAARSSSRRSGRGRPRAAAPSSTSSSASAPPATGRASASPWTRACRRPSSRCSSSSQAGLIYKDKRLVNWDPEFQTAISDLEVDRSRSRARSMDAAISRSRSTPRRWQGARPQSVGHLYHFHYPLSRRRWRGLRRGLHRRRHDAARRRCWATRRSPCIPRTSATGADRQAGDAAAGRARDSDHRRRLCRPREGHRRGQDHAGARLQRLRGRQAARSAADQHLRRQGAAQRERAGEIPRPRPLRRAQAGRRRSRGAGPRRQDRADASMRCRTRSAATPSSSRG